MILPKRTILIGDLGCEESWAAALWTHLILDWQRGSSGSAVARNPWSLGQPELFHRC